MEAAHHPRPDFARCRHLSGPGPLCGADQGKDHLRGHAEHRRQLPIRRPPVWFTLADCIASKLLTGKAPKVVRAIRFLAKAPQPNLRAVEIAGNPEFRVNPYKDDFYKRVIELRRRVKADLKEAKSWIRTSQETKSLDDERVALKILANATSYGIFIELNVEDADNEDAPSRSSRHKEDASSKQPSASCLAVTIIPCSPL